MTPLINLDDHYAGVARELATFALPFALFVWVGAAGVATCYANVEPEAARTAATYWVAEGLVDLPDRLDEGERAALLEGMHALREQLAQKLLPGSHYALLFMVENLPRIYMSDRAESERQAVAVRLAAWVGQVELVPKLYVFAGDMPAAG